MKNLMKLGIIAIVFALVGLSSCTKDESIITGKITYIDGYTGEEHPADGVTVVLQSSAETTLAASDGFYKFENVTNGTHFVESKITVNGHEYWGVSRTFSVTKDDELEIDVVLRF